MSAVLSIAGHLVEVGEDTARTEAATAVVADTVEAETAVNTAAVATVEADTAGPVGTAVASLKGPAAPISAATGNESVPASMARRRLSGRRACDNPEPFGIAGRVSKPLSRLPLG